MLPGAGPQRPPSRECDESPIYYTSAWTVVSDVSNSLACSHICSWLKSETKSKKENSMCFTHPTQMHVDWHTPPSLPETLTVHPHILATLTSHLLSPHTLVLAQLPQMCSHPTHPVDTHTLACAHAHAPPAPVPSWLPAAGPPLSEHPTGCG